MGLTQVTAVPLVTQGLSPAVQPQGPTGPTLPTAPAEYVDYTVDKNPITIGNEGQWFQLLAFENPETIQGLGQEQRHSITDFSGGTRFIQTFGNYPRKISWSGLFMGGGLAQRVAQLQQLSTSGAKLYWKYLYWNLYGILAEFNPAPGYEGYIPYSAVFVPELDIGTKPPPLQTTPSQDAQPAMSQLQAKSIYYQALNGFSAGQLLLIQVLALLGLINALIASNGNILNVNIQTAMIGYVNTLRSCAASFAAIANAYPVTGTDTVSMENASLGMSAAWDLYANCTSAANILASGVAGQSQFPQTLSTYPCLNPNLFEIAAKIYGDAGFWQTISFANGNLPPIGNLGFFQLIIPPLQ